jgi:hypothetical protein
MPLDESYTKAKNNSALDAYAMSLLEFRDVKLKTHSFRDQHIVIAIMRDGRGARLAQIFECPARRVAHVSYILLPD